MPETRKKVFFVALAFDANTDGNHCDMENVPTYLDCVMRDADHQEAITARTNGIKVTYTYRDLTVYESLDDMIADAGEDFDLK